MVRVWNTIMIRATFRFAFALAPAFAFGGEGAQVTERWACFDVLTAMKVERGRPGEPVFRLTRQGVSGQVTVAGTTRFARFQVAGFDRRWDFGPDEDDTFEYAFVISPDGAGKYYDFTLESRVNASQHYKCRQE